MRLVVILSLILLSFPAYGQKKTAPIKPKPKPTIPSFDGVLDSQKEKKRLDDFLGANDRKIVQVHIFLSDEDWKDLVDAGEKRLSICLCWKDKEGDPEGAELVIDLSDGENDLVKDDKRQSITAYLKIIDFTGPNQGLMGIYTKPVPIEKVPQK